MKYEIFVAILLMINIPFPGSSQQKIVPGLAIGDTLPSFKLNLIQSNIQQADISHRYGKAGTIINFWATWCIPCIRELKLLDSITSENSDLLSVLSVTYESGDLVNNFLTRSDLQKLSNLNIIAEDSILHMYFPHKSIPHNIWVDSMGVIKSITSGDEITRENINRFLQNQTVNLYQKIDDLSFDFTKPYNIADSAIGYRSQISGFNDRISSGAAYNPKVGGSTQRYFSWNTRVAELFWMAYSKQMTGRINWNLVELHTDDSVKFYHPRANRKQFDRSRYNTGNFIVDERRWNRDNLYCYDLILPRHVNNTLVSEYMFNDLQRYFRIRSSIKLRKKICRVVSVSSEKVTIADSSAASSIELQDGALIVTNKTIDEFLLYLYEWFGNEQPYINSSNILKPVNVTISLPLLKDRETYSEAEVWEALRKMGIYYTNKKQLYPVLVLNDAN